MRHLFGIALLALTLVGCGPRMDATERAGFEAAWRAAESLNCDIGCEGTLLLNFAEFRDGHAVVLGYGLDTPSGLVYYAFYVDADTVWPINDAAVNKYDGTPPPHPDITAREIFAPVHPELVEGLSPEEFDEFLREFNSP